MTKSLIYLFLIMVLFLSLSPNPTFSGTSAPHLLPEEGMFGVTMLNPYYQAVSERLLSSTHPRRCQVVFLPSFSEESAVYIHYEENNQNLPPVVVSQKLEKQLWIEMHKFMDGDSINGKLSISDPEAQRTAFRSVTSIVNRFEAPIDIKVAATLEKVWDRMIALARFPDKSTHGLDGETYHFANVKGLGYRTAKSWSPSKGTPAYELVELAKALRNYPSLTGTDRKTSAQEMLVKAKNLLLRLENMK